MIYKAKAFTIIELLIVIVIIAVLAALVIVSYSGLSSKANIASLQSDLANNAKLLKLYYSQYNSYPTSLNPNNCPSAPTSDNAYCLKPTNGNTISGYYGSTNSFSLAESNGFNVYIVTESIQPRSADLADGSSASVPATSGYDLKQAYPSKPTGWYWIKSPTMPQALYMYVDMVQEGGGYDFYFITNGPSVNSYNTTNGGTPLGLDLVYPRSKEHWIAMANAVTNARPSGTYSDYFKTTYGVYGTAVGNYTSTIMRSTSYGSGSSSHRVKDGGRWWLRDTVYGEPNGDYTVGGLFGMGSFPNPYTGADLTFNDIFASYFTGNYYLVSTNAKP